MYVILALLLLGVLIIAHEAGHFWAARAAASACRNFRWVWAADCQMEEQKGHASFPFACCLSAAIASFTARTRIAPTARV